MNKQQDERRYEELLALPNLWPADVAILRWLAGRLGRRVEFVRTSLRGEVLP